MEFWLSALLVSLVILVGAFVQRVSGFGFGIIVMTFLPHITGSFPESTALSALVSLFMTCWVALSLVRFCSWKTLVFPLIGSLALTVPCLLYLKSAADRKILFIILGALLILLSVYFLLLSDRVRFRAHWYSGLIFGSVSGAMNGLFSMGGPPMVIYFLQTSEDDKKVYLATIQMFFLITNIFSTAARAVIGGFFTADILKLLPFGLAAAAAGVFAGKAVFGKLDAKRLKYVIYGFMALSGLLNIINALAGS